MFNVQRSTGAIAFKALLNVNAIGTSNFIPVTVRTQAITTAKLFDV